MYDEQSIRSTRSSSRASSFVAASPPIHTPSPSNTGNQQQASAIEYMDIDPESVGVTAQQYQTPPQSQTRPVMRPSALSQSALSSSGLVTTQTATTAAATPTTFTAAPVRESGPRTRSATAAGLQDQPAPSSSASSTTTTTTTAATAVGSDDYSFRTGLSNPRGGTSISSSLLPISPDSDGDDDMDRDVAMDQSPSTPSLAQPHRAHNHTHTHAHGHNHTHGRRFPGPEIFAQIMMSLHESAATTSMTPSAPTAAAAATSEDANSSTMDTTGAPRRPAPTPLGRTRLRSSSMRGLFGYQPTNELADEERPAGPETDATGSAEAETETGAPRAERPGGRFAHQIPLFLQLLAEISRMSRNPSEADSGQTEGADRPADTATGTADAHQHAHPNTTTTGPTHGTDPLVEPSAEPSADAGALPRLRRPNTTIRLIQLGHGVRHPRPAGSTTAGAGATTGATAATTATGEEQAGTEGREGPAAPHGEEVNETFVMFLSPPEGMDEPESDDPAAPGNDDPESARNRARQRAPWVILTLSGAYLNSMMGAGGDGEGGSTYDDLWMLANMIGPARPITTTQEAIDNAGFAVGRFEQALQGMRNVTTLGDGSKCLVCMSEYEEGEDMRALKCNHGFHQECIDKWLTTGANKCPVCRAAAVVTETPMAAEPEVSVNPSAPEE
ncbi:hypothetical protein BGZ97_012157 [Linnemannia gamsii]|uniref:RING-type domain-containing protein n=1 Tax=Linnemannia gamsii TaxID=64522 RepID=A0A9P6RIK6_9FUNG|nr:hypothetical protein BGZ97_012157 [Linnemannia gamsii]